MKAIIVGNTPEEAITFLGLFKQMLEEFMIEKYNKDMIIMKNGDSYYAMSISDNSRCCRCDKLYVNKYIDENTLKEVIYPMISYSCLPTCDRLQEWE